MRVTVCQLPHETHALGTAWAALCEHVRAHESDLVLLPEFATLEPIWESERFDAARWSSLETLADRHLTRLPDLGSRYVVGTRPARVSRRRLNQAFLWSADAGVQPLRSKYFLPDEPGGWEATWFERGDPEFPKFYAGQASFGVNICAELWAHDVIGDHGDLAGSGHRGCRAIGCFQPLFQSRRPDRRLRGKRLDHRSDR
jgi:predicted amidohydrolase